MITKLELENFKSYAGIKTIGPFHKCFSSVVGPNGSGKSNVIDAMLFVFGKRAKKLRLNKVSELIHSSSAYQNNPLGYARVSVYFQEIIDGNGNGNGDSSTSDTSNDDDDDNDNNDDNNNYTIVPNSEIIVSRIAKRDNSSTYKLNHKSVSFSQVSTYLHSKGINLDNNRFLILQGEVEMISMMAPCGKKEGEEGLLEYLEDIIGSNTYVEQTNQAGDYVEELSTVRQEKLNRVKASEKEKAGLEGAKLEAEALLQKEREVRRKQNVLCQLHQYTARMGLEQSSDMKVKLDEMMSNNRTIMETGTARIDELSIQNKTQIKEYETAHASLVETKEEFQKYERRDIQLREEIKHAKSTLKKLAKKVEKDSIKENAALEKISNGEESLPELESKMEEYTLKKKEEHAKLEEIHEHTKDITADLRTQLQSVTETLTPIAQQRSLYQASLDTSTTEMNLLQSSTTRAQSQVDAAEKELLGLDTKQEELRGKLSRKEDELAESKSRMEEARNEDAGYKEKEGALAKKHSEYTARAEECKANMQNSTHRSRAVQGILSAARTNGPLSSCGILGRLGDLATIDQAYDVAISTSCGMLDHIIVQTTAGVQKCLNYLREHNLGRASFLPLDKQSRGRHDVVVQTPESASRLFDLITPLNPQVTPAIFLGVQNTLVAPDLETATRWAYDYGKRWRVVTMDGNLIETSGTMQGGGRQMRRGGMRLRNGSNASNTATADVEMEIVGDPQAECDEAESKAKQALEYLQECRAHRRNLASEVRDLQKRIKSLSVEIPKLSMNIASCDTTREEWTTRLPSMREACVLSEEDAATLTSLQQQVQKCKSDMASCAMQASKLEADVARLQTAILDAGGKRLKKQQKSYDAVLQELNSSTKTLNSTRVMIASSHKTASKAKAAKEASEQEFECNKTLLAEKKEEFKILEEEAYAVMQAYEAVQAVEAEKKKALGEVSKEVEGLKKEQSKLKCMEVELVAKMENCEKAMGDNKSRVKHWGKELKKLRKAEEQDCDYDEDEEEEEEQDDDNQVEEETEQQSNENNADATMTEEQEEGGDSDVEMESGEKSTTAANNVKSRKENKKMAILPIYNDQALEQYDKEEVKNDIATLEDERKTMAKNANMAAIAEYKKKDEDYLARVVELDKVTEERNEARRIHEDLRRQRLEKFMDGFGQITLKLKEMYQMITLGGDAELELVDSLDPFSEGIVFSVRPPKKSWKNISNLSGGEKTLSSLALVFALHHYKPTPLYVMDEIDAALDFRNVSIVANYIKERTKNAQFIIISLRNNMFELADRLVGIYKTNNCTKSITISPRAFSNASARASASPRPLGNRTNEKVVASSESNAITKASSSLTTVNDDVEMGSSQVE